MKNYSIIFTNNKNGFNLDIAKFLCSDNKIHTRFKDFNKEEFLIGFDEKLTYLLSYLINYSYIPKLVVKYSDEDILTSFLLHNDFLQIVDFIKLCANSNDVEFKGLIVKPNYKKYQRNYKSFGDLDIKFFPLLIINNLVEAGDLNLFLKAFAIDLYDYLFNDNYVVWLHNKEFKTNEKFEKRKAKKISRRRDRNANIVELW